MSIRDLHKISLIGHLTRSPYKIPVLCWQDLCQKPLGKISATDLYAISLHKISTRDCPGKISVEAVYKSSLGHTVRTSWQDLKELSWQDLNTFLCTVSVQDAYKTSLSKISVPDP